eukprot:GDKK01018738.1.p1 GENE.GDKK01018738.1~~GDKK01018738.1.p1  ORF type:complete len:144 (-),score=14.58 GDKK01018738.1:99-530(-)
MLTKILKFSTWFTFATLVIVEIIHLINVTKLLGWPKDGFISETEALGYKSVFSLSTGVFINHWTPALFAFLMGVSQWKKYRVEFIMGDFFRYGLFLTVCAVCANFAYAGTLGIIFGSLNLLFALLSLINGIFMDQTGCPAFFD